MEAIVVSTCLGVMASIIAGLLLIWWQFGYSTAGYRIRMVREATEKITLPKANTSMLRDKYRYSLGVIIDDLHQSFKDGFEVNSPWPALIDNGGGCTSQDKVNVGDRWDKFNKYVRPVIEDINTYSFVGLLRLSSGLRNLNNLTELCHRIEDVVGELDAAFESNLVCINGSINRIVIRAGKEGEVENLRRAYCKLYDTWCIWYGGVKEDIEFRKTHGFGADATVQSP